MTSQRQATSMRTRVAATRARPSRASGSVRVVRDAHNNSVNNSNDNGKHSKRKPHGVMERLQRVMHAAPCVATSLPASDAAAAATASVTHADAPRRTTFSLVDRLSTMLHAMCLVTFIERAQSGGFFAAHARHANATATAAAETTTTTMLVCAHVDARWLDAVTRQCGFTVTLDDVAKVAAAFPQWVEVQWSSRRPVTLYTCGNDGSSNNNNNNNNNKEGERSNSVDTATTTALVLPRDLDVAARLRVHGVATDAVPSPARAAAALDARLAALPDELARQHTRRMLACTTAYTALVQQQQQQQRPQDKADADNVDNDRRGNTTSAVPHATDKAATRHAHGKNKSSSDDDDDACEARALLQLQSELSPELRAALSRTKLRDVVAYMKRSRTRHHALTRARIERAQARERLLTTYEHVCSLYGRTRHEWNAWQLLCALEQQSRFDADEHADTGSAAVARDARAQLELLLQHHAHTGLSAVTLGSDADVCDVATLRGLTVAQLQRVLVRLDRRTASLRGLQAALQHEHTHDEQQQQHGVAT